MAQNTTEYSGAAVLDNFDVLNLADMALERRQRLFEAAGMPWPENELKDAVKISILLDAADEWGVRQAEDSVGFRREVEETVALARQYFTVEGVQ